MTNLDDPRKREQLSQWLTIGLKIVGLATACLKFLKALSLI
jgi:hypothetical protein